MMLHRGIVAPLPQVLLLLFTVFGNTFHNNFVGVADATAYSRLLLGPNCTNTELMHIDSILLTISYSDRRRYLRNTMGNNNHNNDTAKNHNGDDIYQNNFEDDVVHGPVLVRSTTNVLQLPSLPHQSINVTAMESVHAMKTTEDERELPAINCQDLCQGYVPRQCRVSACLGTRRHRQQRQLLSVSPKQQTQQQKEHQQHGQQQQQQQQHTTTRDLIGYQDCTMMIEHTEIMISNYVYYKYLSSKCVSGRVWHCITAC